jgi:hypothetical protein
MPPTAKAPLLPGSVQIAEIVQLLPNILHRRFRQIDDGTNQLTSKSF